MNAPQIRNRSAAVPAPSKRNAWREEMLDKLLEDMRSRQLPDAAPNASPARREAFGKGQYVDVYV
ncbi:MAG: hypothetical protein LBU12_07430 [Deltaproteobacteria bacterium]|jgi:hypothetical protein|nr:hypothetical protein [Deltaproteobacteria bacterium]